MTSDLSTAEMITRFRDELRAADFDPAFIEEATRTAANYLINYVGVAVKA